MEVPWVSMPKSSAARRRLTTLSRSFRCEQEIRSAADDERKRQKLRDEFTPRLEITLVGLQGKLDREIKARVRYAFDAEPDYRQCSDDSAEQGRGDRSARAWSLLEIRPVSAHFVHRNVRGHWRESTATFARRVCGERTFGVAGIHEMRDTM